MNVELIWLFVFLLSDVDNHDLLFSDKTDVLTVDVNIDFLNEGQAIDFIVVVIEYVNALVLVDIRHKFLKIVIFDFKYFDGVKFFQENDEIPSIWSELNLS